MATKLVSNAQEIVKQLSPFFTASIHFRSASGNYDCALCGMLVKDNDKSALSYGASHYGTWVHTACVTRARAEVNDDKDAKKKAHEAAKKRDQKGRSQSRSKGTAKTQDKGKTESKTPSEYDLLVARLVDQEKQAAAAETKYENLMTQALELINALEEKLAGANAQIDQMRAALTEKDKVAA